MLLQHDDTWYKQRRDTVKKTSQHVLRVEANTKGGKEIQLIQKGEATAFTLDFAIHEGPLGIQNKMSPTQTL